MKIVSAEQFIHMAWLKIFQNDFPYDPEDPSFCQISHTKKHLTTSEKSFRASLTMAGP